MKGIIRVCFLFGISSSFLYWYQVSAQLSDNPDITCSPNEMEFSIQRSSLPSLKLEELSLNDRSCLAEERSGNIYFKTAFDKCGTTIQVTKSEIIYSNKVRSRAPPGDAVIDHIRNVEIAFSCSYSRKKKLTSSNLQPSNTLPIMKAYKAKGTFDFSLDLFPSAQFNNAYSNYPVTVNLRELIYVQVKVESVREQLSILAQNCYATPIRDVDDPKHVMIENSCPKDPKLTIIKSSDKNIQRFSIPAFYFLGDKYTYVYFHCHVIACDGSDDTSVCARGCTSKRSLLYKRSHKGMKTFKLTQGPILVRKELDVSKESKLHSK